MPPDRVPEQRKPIGVLIVDDEQHVRHHLRDVLTKQPDVNLLGEAGDGPAAIEAIERLRPDLVLLDVQMPGCDGFEVLRQLDPDHLPAVIFVTAFEQYALRAFDAHAIDYLLKPFDDGRLVSAMERARAWLLAQPSSPQQSLPALLQTVGNGRPRDRFVVRQAGRIRVVPASEVEWIEARGNYVHLHTSSGPLLVREALTALETSLDPRRFVRVHRSAIVTLAHIVAIERLPSGAQQLLLSSGAHVPLGRSYREALQQRWTSG